MKDKLVLQIREKREQMGYSLSELSRRTGISKAYLSQLENGKIFAPNIMVMLKLSVVLDTPIEGLIKDWEFTGVKEEKVSREIVYTK